MMVATGYRKPLDSERVLVPTGQVFVIAERCKGCRFCIEFCPRDVLVMSSRFNRRGYHTPEVKDGGVCFNCDLCEMICPDFAIFSKSIEEEFPPLADGSLGAHPEP